jgi:uncharacterized damage-inducible protein DinB
MKLESLLLAGCLVAVAQSGHAQSAELRRSYDQVTGWILKAAEAVPPERYAWRPVETVRTFGELVAHVADEINYFSARAAGRDVEWSDASEKGPRDKATVVAALRRAVAAGAGAYGAGQVGPLVDNNADAYLHYGNIATYLRLMGMVPPSSQ